MREKLNTKPFQWEGKEAVLSLTHDVDNKMGYRFIADMIRTYKNVDISATFNFLTDYDYSIEQPLLTALKDLGCEIGLHGYRHDISLAYRRKKYILNRLSKALKALPVAVSGYRSPALSNSESLFEVLDELGIQYDSTLQVTNTFYKSVETCFPYPYKHLNVWEFPLTLQDDIFFRDSDLKESEALQQTIHIIEQVRDMGGVCILNLHPHLLSQKTSYFEGIVDYVVSQSNVWICPLQSVYHFLNDRWPPSGTDRP